MDRRSFLKSAGAAATASALPWRAALAAEGWQAYEIVSRVEILKPSGVSRTWVPLPLSDDTPWHKAVGNAWSGNAAQARVMSDGKYGVGMLVAEWSPGVAEPVIEVTSRFMTRERSVDLSRPGADPRRLSAEEQAFYTAPTELIPTDGIVKQTAQQVTQGARGDVDKARAIYEWVVDNTFRDPKTRGCGWGDIKSMLESGNLGGKCGDLNAMFVGLARAAGLPARDIYGLRVAPSMYGYRSLGVGSPNVTRAQHCRAEFFAKGYGWVPVDPADVRKVILEEPPGNLPAGDAKVAAARKRLFGAWEMNWLAYNMGHDIALPGASGPKLSYLMYINAQTGGMMRDQLDPDSVKYAITARAV
ncbi:MAG TPA: transglutaminase domain-containing protein [Burkholderiales bacterium]|nr:transglutaminase domain-containing protein [Burkholderiales bacterium]